MLCFALARASGIRHAQGMSSYRPFAHLIVLGCAFAALAASSACSQSGQTGSPATSGGSGGGPATGGQAGAPVGPAECQADADCTAGMPVAQWTEPLAASITLVSATCAQSDPLPACNCAAHVVPSDGSAYDTTFTAGARGFPEAQGCSEFGRAGSCLYCAAEFPGCHVESPDTGCASVCDDLVERVRQEWQRTYTVDVRVARCVSNRCERVVEIDGRCYVGEVLPDSAGYDCALSDEALLARGISMEPTCPAPSAPTCATADDCPGGLACNGGVCGPCDTACSQTWTYPDGNPALEVCEGDGACASGERCALGLCVPEALMECRDWLQCPTDQACVLSGVDFGVTRGNATTRAFCQAP
jgi:hypothetical protein